MEDTQRLEWDDDEEETPGNRDRPVGNLHMFAGTHGPAQDYPIYLGQNLVGRHASCDITLPAQSVSKKHAILEVKGDCHTICDNASLNKTRRAKAPLNPHVHYALSDGDFLLFADVACRYTIEKKVAKEQEAPALEESEDDSVLVPGTQGALAMEKTPGVAIRRMVRGTVLARDSGDEDDEAGEQRRWNEGGFGSFKDRHKTSGPGSIFSPITDTIVPESDEENDTSTSEPRFPSLNLRCDSDADPHETPTRGSSFTPSSLNIFTPPALKEQVKNVSKRLAPVGKEEKPANKRTDGEGKLRLVGEDMADTKENQEREQKADAMSDDGLSGGGGHVREVVGSDGPDAKSKEGGLGATNLNKDNNAETLKDTRNKQTPEILSTDNPCVQGDGSSRRDTVRRGSGDIDPNSDAHLEEDNIKPTDADHLEEDNIKPTDADHLEEDNIKPTDADHLEEDNIKPTDADHLEEDNIKPTDADHLEEDNIKPTDADNLEEDHIKPMDADHLEEDHIKPTEGDLKTKEEGGFCIDSGTDDDEGDMTTSGTDIKKTDGGQELNDGKTSATSGGAIHLDSDTDVDEDDAATSGADLENAKTRQMNIDSDTDIQEAEKSANAKPKKSDTTEVNPDNDTDVEDDPQEMSKKDNAETSRMKGEDHKTPMTKETTRLDIDSDTDVEDTADIAKPDASKMEQDSRSTIEGKKDGLHPDTDTDGEEDIDAANTVKVKKDELDSTTGTTVKEPKDGFHLDSDTDVDEDVDTSTKVMAKEEPDSGTTSVNVQEIKGGFNLDSDTDVDEDDPRPGSSSAAAESRPTSGLYIDDQKKPGTAESEKNEIVVAPKEAAALHVDSDTDVDEDDVQATVPVWEEAKAAAGTAKRDIAKTEMDVTDKEAAALHMDSDTDVEEDDVISAVPGLEKAQATEGNHNKGASVEVCESGMAPGSSAGALTKQLSAETANIPADKSTEEEETQTTDSESIDFEMMATQCYLEPQEPESDLPDEEEATQAYVFSSTWVEPDPFKRPADPIGVLQISAVSLDTSEEEFDENAIAETQPFCSGAESPMGLRVDETPEIVDESVDDHEATQPAGNVEESGKDLQQRPCGSVTQEDTEPVSQYLSKSPQETGTWLLLKRDVPASVWVRGIQQEGADADKKEDHDDEDDATQADEQVPCIELEATQPYTLDNPALQNYPGQVYTPDVPAAEEDGVEPGISTVPPTEGRTSQPCSVETQAMKPGISAVPPTEGRTSQPCSVETQAMEPGISAVPPTEGRTSQPCSLETQAMEPGISAVPPTEGRTSQLCSVKTQAMEPGISAVLPTEGRTSQPCSVETQAMEPGISAVPPTEGKTSQPCRVETQAMEPGISAVPPTESRTSQPCSVETQAMEPGISAVPPTEGRTSQPCSVETQAMEPGISAVPPTEGRTSQPCSVETQAMDDDDATQAYSLSVSDNNANQGGSLPVQTTGDAATQPSSLNVLATEGDGAQPSRSLNVPATEEDAKDTLNKGRGKPSSRRGLSRSRKGEEPTKNTQTTAETAEHPEASLPVPDSLPEEVNGHDPGEPKQSGTKTKEEPGADHKQEPGEPKQSGTKTKEEPGADNKQEPKQSGTKTKEEPGADHEQEPGEPTQSGAKTKEEPGAGKGGRRGARRMGAVEAEDKITTKEEVVTTATRKRTNKMASEAEPSTSGIEKVGRKPRTGKSVVKVTKEEVDERKAEAAPTTEESKDIHVPKNPPITPTEKIETSEEDKKDDVVQQTSEKSGDEALSASLDHKGNGGETATTVVESEELMVSEGNSAQMVPEASSDLQNKKRATTKRRAATKLRNNNSDEAESRDNGENMKDENIHDQKFKVLQEQDGAKRSRSSGSQEVTHKESLEKRKTRKSAVTPETVEQDKKEGEDTTASMAGQNEAVRKVHPADPISGNEKSKRLRRNLREVKEEPEKVEQAVKTTTRRSMTSRGGEKKIEEKEVQAKSEDTAASNTTPRRMRENSKEETAKPEEDVKVEGNTEEDDMVTKPRRTRKNLKEQKTEDHIGNQEDPRTSESQTTRRSRRECREDENGEKETVKETVSRRTRTNSMEEEVTKLEDDQSKKSGRARKGSKEELKTDQKGEETIVEAPKEDPVGRKTTRRTRQNIKDEKKAGSEHEVELKQEEVDSKSDRSSSRTRRKRSAEESEEVHVGTETKEVEEAPKEDPVDKKTTRRTKQNVKDDKVGSEHDSKHAEVDSKVERSSSGTRRKRSAEESEEGHGGTGTKEGEESPKEPVGKKTTRKARQNVKDDKVGSEHDSKHAEVDSKPERSSSGTRRKRLAEESEEGHGGTGTKEGEESPKEPVGKKTTRKARQNVKDDNVGSEHDSKHAEVDSKVERSSSGTRRKRSAEESEEGHGGTGTKEGEESPKEPVGKKTTRKARQNVKDDKVGSEHDSKHAEVDSKPERSSSGTRRKRLAEESAEGHGGTGTKEGGESPKEPVGKKTTRKARQNVKDDKVGSEHDSKHAEVDSKVERSSSVTRRKRSAEESEEGHGGTGTKEGEESPKEPVGKKTTRKARQNVKDDKVGSEHELKPAEVDAKPERSTSRTRKKRLAEESEEGHGGTETKEGEESPKDPVGKKTTRRTRQNVKDDKVGSEHELKQAEVDAKPERSTSGTRRKRSAEESGELHGGPETKEGPGEAEVELSARKEKSRLSAGRSSRSAAKEEMPEVSTPVAARKREQAPKAEVEVKRKKSDEGLDYEELPSRRGQPRRLVAEVGNTQAGNADLKDTSPPTPSPSRGSRQRPSSVFSSPSEVRTPRRTSRMSSSATSPYVSHSGSAPKVLFTGVVDAVGEGIIRTLGGDIADSVFDCTHLVTDRVRRTVKFLCALARGIPIVTLDWIDKCKKSGCFLSPTGFLVTDKEQEKNFNFMLTESLQKAKRRPLFEGYEIHVTANVKPEPEHMKDIIRCSGAAFLPKLPRTFKEKCVVVSCPEDAARCKSVPSSVPITSAEFILSGILRQEVNPAAYLLNPANARQDNAPTAAKRRR